MRQGSVRGTARDAVLARSNVVRRVRRRVRLFGRDDGEQCGGLGHCPAPGIKAGGAGCGPQRVLKGVIGGQTDRVIELECGIGNDARVGVVHVRTRKDRGAETARGKDGQIGGTDHSRARPADIRRCVVEVEKLSGRRRNDGARRRRRSRRGRGRRRLARGGTEPVGRRARPSVAGGVVKSDGSMSCSNEIGASSVGAPACACRAMSESA